MIINHPLLGPRDAAEFTYMGDVSLMDRPEWDGNGEPPMDEFHDFVYLRDNPAGWHKELWFHEQGDRSWLVVERNTVSHEIRSVALAKDVARSRRKSQ